MKTKLFSSHLKTFVLLGLLFSFSLVTAQTTIASWTYDAVQGTINNPTPNFGTGTSSVVNLGAPTTAAGLSSTTGCGSANSGLGWQNPNFNPGSSNEVNGVQYNVGTTGYNNIIISWDQRFSKTSPNTVRLQYTTDGTTWTNFIMTGTNTTICAGSINANGCFETNTGDSFRRIRVDLSSITAANINANFGIRLLASQYQSTGQYRQSTTPTTIATTTGTWRFDNVNFLGTPITTGAVLSGSTTICPSSSANINVTITSGASPYTVTYTDGTSNYTVNNYTSGANISVAPSVTSTYTLVSVKDNTNATVSPISGSAVITVNAGTSPSFITAAAANSCPGSSIVYTTQAGMDNYAWTFLKGASPAVLGTDYNMIAGSTATETVTIQWLLASGTATFSTLVTYSSCSGTSATSATTVAALPNVTFTSQPGTSACIGTNVTYTTQTGQSNYTWTISGTAGTNYTLISGGTLTDNTLVIKWLNTSGANTVSVNYSNTNGCAAASPTISTATTTLNALPSVTFTTVPAATICSTATATYTTQAGNSNYSWVVPGIAGTDYTITAGGIGTTSNTVTIKWLTGGSKVVTVNYNNASGCTATTPASNTTTINLAPTITVQPSTAAQTVCQGTAFSPMSVTATGSPLAYQWWVRTTYLVGAPSGGSPVSGATSSSYTPPSSSPIASNYYYVIVSTTSCAAVKSAALSFAYVVNATSVGGAITGSASVCTSTNSTTLTLSGYTGTITKWQSSPVIDFSSGVVDIANTTTTQVATNLTVTTYYRAVVTSGVCSSANSSVATITVSPLSVGGTITGGGTICSGTNSTIFTLTGQVGSIIKWQSSTVSDFSASVTDISNTAASYNAINLTSTTYFRAVIQSGPCSIAYSSIDQAAFVTTTWNGSTWDNGTPNSSTKAIFASSFTSSGDLQACSLEVLTGAIVTVQYGDSFIIQNEVIVDGAPLPAALIFQDGASLIQVNNVVNSSYIYYRRNSMPMRKYDYTYWSSPVQNQVLNVFSPNTMADKFFNWDAATYNWSPTLATASMTVAKGYIIRAPDVAPFTTTTSNVFNSEFFGIPNNGTITTPILKSGTNDLNLIGNPYPSAIDADTFLNYNSVANGGVLAGTMYFWTHNTPITANNYAYNDYASYNLTGGVGTIAQSSPCLGCNNAIPNGKVAAGQSFFIQGVGNGVATFTNAMRFGTNTQFFKNSTTINQQMEKSRLWLTISNNSGSYKEMLLGYIPEASNDFDTAFDGLSMDAGNSIMIYSILNDKKLGIQGRAIPFNSNDEIPLGYKSTVAGNFEINLSNFDGIFYNQEVYIVDELLNQTYNLKNGSYTFSTEAGTFDTRFKLRFNNSSLSNTNFSSLSDAFIIVKSKDKEDITIKSQKTEMSEIVVYDMQGRVLNDFKNVNASEFQFTAPRQQQIVVLKIITTDNYSLYKKFSN